MLRWDYRQAQNNFRYLFENVSGIVTGWSQIKLRRDYTGACANIGTNDYGFVDGIVPMSLILSDFPLGTGMNSLYDQISFNDLITTNPAHTFDSSIENFDLITEGSSIRVINPSNLDNISSQNPATIYFILQKTISASGVMFAMNETSTLRFDMQFQGNGNLLLRMNNVTVSYGTSFNTNVENNLWCVTYDGSQSTDGLKLYRNDMINEVSFTTRTSPATVITPSVFNQVYALGISTAGNNCVLGLHTSMIVCETQHTQTERETTKEILEQYFIFG